MTITVDFYKGCQKLGSGTATAASTSVTSYSANLSRTLNTGRRVNIVPTTGNNQGASWPARVVTDGGATITLDNPCPYS